MTAERQQLKERVEELTVQRNRLAEWQKSDEERAEKAEAELDAAIQRLTEKIDHLEMDLSEQGALLLFEQRKRTALCDDDGICVSCGEKDGVHSLDCNVKIFQVFEKRDKAVADNAALLEELERLRGLKQEQKQ